MKKYLKLGAATIAALVGTKGRATRDGLSYQSWESGGVNRSQSSHGGHNLGSDDNNEHAWNRLRLYEQARRLTLLAVAAPPPFAALGVQPTRPNCYSGCGACGIKACTTTGRPIRTQ